ncbi:MAG: hypothetical protein ACOC1N_02345 [Bacillota bacterium]
MKHKLIIIEGVPGVGKTTTVSLIKENLDNNITSNLFMEGDLNHPADLKQTLISRMFYIT